MRYAPGKRDHHRALPGFHPRSGRPRPPCRCCRGRPSADAQQPTSSPAQVRKPGPRLPVPVGRNQASGMGITHRRQRGEGIPVGTLSSRLPPPPSPACMSTSREDRGLKERRRIRHRRRRGQGIPVSAPVSSPFPPFGAQTGDNTASGSLSPPPPAPFSPPPMAPFALCGMEMSPARTSSFAGGREARDWLVEASLLSILA